MTGKLFSVSLTLALGVLLTQVWAAEPESPTRPTDLEGMPSVLRHAKSNGDRLLRYSLRFAGSDAESSLIVSNPTRQAGVIRTSSTSQGPRVFKVAPGRSAILSARQTGWDSGDNMTLKISSGLQASLRSSSKLVRLPQVDGVRSYEVFSNGFSADYRTGGAARTVTPLDSDGISMAYVQPPSERDQQLPRVAADQPGQQAVTSYSAKLSPEAWTRPTPAPVFRRRASPTTIA